ncbi:MAG TPA: hypothetical protein VGT05_03910 [Patescibacteria group bacterium]|nr:hypothetical protein [Patescibacteria group bacterium]
MSRIAEAFYTSVYQRVHEGRILNHVDFTIFGLNALRTEKEKNPLLPLVLVSGAVTPREDQIVELLQKRPGLSRDEAYIKILKRNEAILRANRMYLQKQYPSHNFITSADLMPSTRIHFGSMTNDQFRQAWDTFVRSGFINELVALNGAHLSKGANIEHDAALDQQLPIYYESPEERNEFLRRAA